MLCSAMLCYAILCYAVLCYAMLCYAMLCYAMLCCAVLCYAMLCCAMLSYALLCYVMLCHAMLCYAVLQVARIVGVNEGYIGQRCRGGGAQSDASAKHARFAAACALNALLCEQSAWAVEQTWGLPSSLTQQGQPLLTYLCSHQQNDTVPKVVFACLSNYAVCSSSNLNVGCAVDALLYELIQAPCPKGSLCGVDFPSPCPAGDVSKASRGYCPS